MTQLCVCVCLSMFICSNNVYIICANLFFLCFNFQGTLSEPEWKAVSKYYELAALYYF